MAAFAKWRLFVACLVYLSVNNIHEVDSSEELIKKMSTSFFKALQECKKELSVPEEVIQALMNFWKKDADLTHRELGCVIMCMAAKQDLVEMEAYKLHHNNALQYAMNHGADEATAHQITNLLRGCEKKYEANADHCARLLEAARCFHGHVHELNWAPNMEVIIGEIMAGGM